MVPYAGSMILKVKKQRNYIKTPFGFAQGRLRYTKETLPTTHLACSREKTHRKNKADRVHGISVRQRPACAFRIAIAVVAGPAGRARLARGAVPTGRAGPASRPTSSAGWSRGPRGFGCRCPCEYPSSWRGDRPEKESCPGAGSPSGSVQTRARPSLWLADRRRV